MCELGDGEPADLLGISACRAAGAKSEPPGARRKSLWLDRPPRRGDRGRGPERDWTELNRPALPPLKGKRPASELLRASQSIRKKIKIIYQQA